MTSAPFRNRLYAAPLLSVAMWFPAQSAVPQDKTEIEVSVVWVDGDQEVGVESSVYEMGSEQQFATDEKGKAVLSVSACNSSVRIAAKPVYEIFETSQVPCDGSPLKIQIRALYSEFVPRIFLDTDTRASIEAAGLGNVVNEMTEAYRVGDFRRISQLAASSSFELRKTKPSIAQALSVISMDAGFRAIRIEPTDPSQPLIAYDQSQDLYVMTQEGASIYDRIVSGEGVVETGRWTPNGIDALTSSNPARDFDFRMDM